MLRASRQRQTIRRFQQSRAMAAWWNAITSFANTQQENERLKEELAERDTYIEQLEGEVVALTNEVERLRLELANEQASGGQVISEMRQNSDELKAEVERLQTRDGNATIELCFSDGNNPFAREKLKIIDFGVADNVYVVEKNRVENKPTELDALPCPACGGRGQYSFPEASGVDGTDGWYTCDRCDGRGRLPKKVR